MRSKAAPDMKKLRKELRDARDAPLSAGDFAAYLMIALCFIFLTGSIMRIGDDTGITGLAVLNETGNYTIPVNETIPINETNTTIVDGINATLNETNSTFNSTVDSPNATIVDEINATLNETNQNNTVPINETQKEETMGAMGEPSQNESSGYGTMMLGSGTLADPYQITNCTELQNMSLNLGANYSLMNDIDCSDTVNWNYNGSDYLGFKSVGANYTHQFTGTLDGQNHTITNLYIYRPDFGGSSASYYVGLFGFANASIQNVGLEDVNITGVWWVGGLVGRNEVGNVSNCYVTGSVNAGYAKVGGLVGYNNYGWIDGSYASVNVKGGSDNYVGGLVGHNNYGHINNSYATGNVSDGNLGIGGLVGGNSWGTIDNCYAIGNVNATAGDRVGGLVGSNFLTNISNSYATGNVNGSSNVGGLIGNFISGITNNNYWNNHSGNSDDCYNGGNTNCVAIQDNELYFFNISNPPMSSWSFPPWDSFCNNSGYTSLEWENITSVSECRGYSAPPQQPNSTEFNTSYGSTNFSAVPDIENVTNMTLATQYGKIKFPADYGVNASGEDYDAYIEIGNRFISVNTSELHSTFNNSANLTMNDVNCPATVYYGAGVYTTAQQIINEGNVCNSTTDPNCTNINCSGSTLNFTASHFTGFGAQEGNNPPTQGIPILNSTSGTNYTTENLTVYNQSTSDADGDPVKNIINWYLNGTSIAVLNMPFEKNTANVSNSTKDYSGFGNNGTVYSAVWNSTGGYDGKGAYRLDGVDDKIVLPASSNWNLYENWSMTFWIYQDSRASWGATIWSYVPPSTPNPDWFEIYLMDDGYIDIGAQKEGTASSKSYTSQGVVPLDTWTHIAIVSTGYSVTLYQSLGNAGTGTIYPGENATNPVSVNMGWQGMAGRQFDGYIDDFMLWNRSLSIEQITALYNNKTDLIVSNETSLGDVWRACVTPNDGYEDGATNCSNNLTVVEVPPNNPPTQGIPILNSTSRDNLYTDNLTVYNQSTSDADNDPVKNIINWYKDGTSIAVLNMPFEALTPEHSDVADQVSAWFFEGDADDETGRNNGTAGENPSLVTGKVGQAYEFNGTNYIDVGNMSDFGSQIGTSTLSFWMKTEYTGSTTGIIKIIDKAGYSTDVVYSIEANRGGATCYGSTNNPGLTLFSIRDNTDKALGKYINTDIYDNEWHHIIWRVIDSTANSVEVYVDGQSQTLYDGCEESPSSFNDWNNTLIIGGANNRGAVSGAFKGTIDEVQIWNQSLSVIEIRELYRLGLSSTEGARDYSGYENVGNVNGATFNSAAGYDGKGAYRLDGVDDKIVLPASSDWNLYENWSMTFWVYQDNRAGWGATIWSYIPPSTPNPDWFEVYLMNDGYINVGARKEGSESSKSYTSQGVVPLDTWTHIAIVSTGYSVTLYQDLGNAGTGTIYPGENATNPANVNMGWQGSAGREFDGYIDDFMLWNRSLSIDQITALYNNRTDMIVSNETSAGDVWRACITPNDGYEDGATNCSNNLTVADANATYTNFNGSTTDFNNHPTPRSIYGAILEVVPYGKIVWYGPVTAVNQDFDANANISYNHIFVNSTALDSSYNSSANITINGLSFSEPIIEVDLDDDGTFTECNSGTDPACYNLSWNGSTFVFNITHFTTFQAAEGANNPPTQGTPILNSTSGTNSVIENITCWANATDADEDNVSYEGYWYRNGVQNISLNTTPSNYTPGILVNVSTLNSSMTSIGDNWSCYVRAFDGINYSSYVMSDNLTILEVPSAPVINSINATPSQQGYGKNVTITANITDQDNDIDTVLVGIAVPGQAETNYSMANVSEIYYFKYLDYANGTYNVTVYVNDTAGLSAKNSTAFELFVNNTVQIKTLKDSYGENEWVNLTDPPNFYTEVLK